MDIISLGAGVQSSTMALMASTGALPKPACAIFADTQNEPASVYEWLDYLEPLLAFPVYRVTAGNLGEAATRLRQAKTSGNFYQKHTVPAFIAKKNGGAGMLPRHCTLDFKITVIQRKVRELVGRKGKATMWIGISTDEAHRMKPSRKPFIVNTWPLIEAGISRQACLDWMAAGGYKTPPRSSCTFCPYHNDLEWSRLKQEEPAAFQEAVEFEKRYQRTFEGVTKIDGVPFLHRSLKPIDQVDFDTEKKQTDNFGNECEGMCGV